MRITQNMMVQQFLYNLSVDNQQLQTAQIQMSTGKTFNEPSDNPLGVSQDMSIRSLLERSNAYSSVISAGLTWMNNTSSAIAGMVQTLRTISQDVIEGINTPSQNPSQMAALSEQAQGLAQGLSQDMNAQQGTRYLFGGQATTTQPSSYAGYGATAAAPVGASAPIEYQVADGVQIAVNVTAAELFQTTPTGAANDLQTTLQNIVSDLQSQNTSGLQSDLTDLNANINNVINVNARLGTQIQRMQAAQNQMTQYTSIMTNQKGVIEDANEAKVITNFSTDQTVYEAALQMGAQILLPSLVNYLPS